MPRLPFNLILGWILIAARLSTRGQLMAVTMAWYVRLKLPVVRLSLLQKEFDISACVLLGNVMYRLFSIWAWISNARAKNEESGDKSRPRRIDKIISRHMLGGNLTPFIIFLVAQCCKQRFFCVCSAHEALHNTAMIFYTFGDAAGWRPGIRSLSTLFVGFGPVVVNASPNAIRARWTV